MQSNKEVKIENYDKTVIVEPFDRLKPVQKLLDKACQSFHLTNVFNHSLVFKASEEHENDLTYLNDENKWEFKSSKLFITESPDYICNNLKNTILTSPGNLSDYRGLVNHMGDKTFCHVFNKVIGAEFIFKLYLNSRNIDDKQLLIQILSFLYNYTKLSKEHEQKLISDTLQYCKADGASKPIMFKIYDLYSYLLKSDQDNYDAILDSIELSRLIQTLKCEDEKIHTPVLKLINTVFKQTPEQYQEDLMNVILEENELKNTVMQYVLVKSRKLSSDLKQEIFRLQNMLLFRELNRSKTYVSMGDKEIQEFKKIILHYDPNEMVNIVLKRLGFKNQLNIHRDLNQITNLTMDCFKYFIAKNPEVAFYPDIGPSLIEVFKLATVSLTTTLKNFSPEGTVDFLPMLFEKPNPIHEMVSKLIKNYRTFVKDYAINESNRIISEFSGKIKIVLQRVPFDFDRFCVDLEKLDKARIFAIMNNEISKWDELIKNNEAVKRLRLYYAPRVEELIKKQTFSFMSQGISAEYIPILKSKKAVKEEKLLFKLNTAQNGFEFALDSGYSINTIALSEISKIYFGELARGMIDEKILKKIPISTIVVFEAKTEEKHAFSIEPTHHQSINDVINLAENKKIDDTWEPNSYSALLDSLVNIFLMDLTENDIPKGPPPVPEPPPHFNFVEE